MSDMETFAEQLRGIVQAYRQNAPTEGKSQAATTAERELENAYNSFIADKQTGDRIQARSIKHHATTAVYFPECTEAVEFMGV